MSDSMKEIIFISHESKLLGAPNVLLHIIKYFHSLDKYNLLIICPEEGPFKDAIESKNLPVLIPACFQSYYKHIGQPGNRIIKILKRVYDNGKLFIYFFRLFIQHKNSIIYANTSVVRYLAFPALLSRARLLWHVHEYSINPWKQRFHAFLMKLCATRIILHSPYLVSRLKLNQRAQKKVVFFRYPTILDPEKYRQIASHQPAYDLIFAGKIGLEKGVLDLLKAIANAVRIKKDLKVIMAGLFIAKDKELILNFVTENKLDNYVTFAGFVPDLTKYILDSKVVVLPTYRDYFPLLLMEAVALEKPVISTNVGDICSIITHNFNGIIVEPGNVQQLTDAIIHILDEATYCQFITNTKKTKATLLLDQTDFKKLEQVIDNL